MTDQMNCLETARLIVRCYQPADAAAYLAMGLRNRDHLARYEADNPIRSLETVADAEKLLNDYIQAWQKNAMYFWGVFDKDTGALLGQVYVGVANPALPEYMVGYIVDEGQAGRGIITEAVGGVIRVLFEYHGAKRLCLMCDDTNLASMRVAEKCGFIKEGHLRQNKCHADGSISGTLHFGMLWEDWQAQVPLATK